MGRRLAALLLSVATGATWPKARNQAVLSSASRQAIGDDDECDRCSEESETSLHRYWTCRCNTGCAAYERSDILIPQAC
eukprot:4926972-Pyramimonas_sp.AAC.1